MWKEGPTRLFSSLPFLGARPYSAGGMRGYVGCFVCDRCGLRVLKVSGCFGCEGWLCVTCAGKATETSRPVSVQIEA